MVEKWFTDFKRGRTNTDNAERSRRPNLAVVPENLKKDHKMVLADLKLKSHEIADTLFFVRRKNGEIFYRRSTELS